MIRALPNGVYTANDYIDGVGERSRRRSPIVATVTIADDTIDIDFAGTRRSGRGLRSTARSRCRNRPRSPRSAACRSSDIPNCEGYLRPITVRAPEGCLVNPRYPAACGARGVVGYRVFDAIMQALAQVVPERAIGGSEGGPLPVRRPAARIEGRQFVLNEMLVGTWGARAGKDGIEGISNPAANLSNQPIEMIEAEMPVEVLRYGCRRRFRRAGRDSAAGSPSCASSASWQRRASPCAATGATIRPIGFEGGGTGAPSAHLLITSGWRARMLPTMPMESFTAKRRRHLPADRRGRRRLWRCALSASPGPRAGRCAGGQGHDRRRRPRLWRRHQTEPVGYRSSQPPRSFAATS